VFQPGNAHRVLRGRARRKPHPALAAVMRQTRGVLEESRRLLGHELDGMVLRPGTTGKTGVISSQ
jgi:hypothetical protein